MVFRRPSSSAESQIAQPCELIETCKLAIHEIERLLSALPREVSVTGLLLVD